MNRLWFLLFVIVFIILSSLVNNAIIQVYGEQGYLVARSIGLIIFGIALYHRYKNAGLEKRTYTIAYATLFVVLFFGPLLWALIIHALVYKPLGSNGVFATIKTFIKGTSFKNTATTIGIIIYIIGNIATFGYLTFFDGYVYNMTNWIIALPANEFLGLIWPIYWGLLHWIF